ncbi:class I SAM-dependent methyltransferase [Methanobrevibacter sp. V14]|uniref:class I SAM-dependent methyltransferase n=1 Tax=Methanobrevibacter sp. V14 TaxID=3064280 RepID=UPI0027348059|nr:class I SAM-dependent methyltransferase [Methanobrevibacter sp. V14]
MIFLDVGCGEGYISIKAAREYLSKGVVYAVDSHVGSIMSLEDYIQEYDIKNIISIESDIINVSDIDEESIDVVLMVNVFHGFKASGEMDEVIEILKKLIKSGGRIVIVDFKAIEMSMGPPVEIRSSPEELENLFLNHGLKRSHLNENIGNENSHYLIIFEKE